MQVSGDKRAKISCLPPCTLILCLFSYYNILPLCSWPLYTVRAPKSFEGREQSECLCVQIASSLVIIYKHCINGVKRRTGRSAQSSAEIVHDPDPHWERWRPPPVHRCATAGVRTAMNLSCCGQTVGIERNHSIRTATVNLSPDHEPFFFLLCSWCPQVSLNRAHSTKCLYKKSTRFCVLGWV